MKKGGRVKGHLRSFSTWTRVTGWVSKGAKGHNSRPNGGNVKGTVLVGWGKRHTPAACTEKDKKSQKGGKTGPGGERQERTKCPSTFNHRVTTIDETVMQKYTNSHS